MILHENKELFKEIIDILSIKENIRADIIEKDYYVCLMLEELAQKQKSVNSYFKGGTALYKILNDPKRFSEDIDLTVQTKELSNNQAKKALEFSSNKFLSLPRLKGDPMEENKKGSITTVYEYDSLYPIKEDALQRYGKVKIEATSFTISEPVEKFSIEPLIYKLGKKDNEIKKYLDELECTSFELNIISLERIFVDKLLAIEFYYDRCEFFDVAKHIYDIYQMYNLPQIKKIFKDEDLLIMTLSYKRLEEINRIGSDLYYKPLNNFMSFKNLNIVEIEESYNKMLEIYVFNEMDKIPFSEILNIINRVAQKMYEISKKEQLFLQSDIFREKCKTYNINYNEVYKDVFTKDNIQIE